MPRLRTDAAPRSERPDEPVALRFNVSRRGCSSWATFQRFAAIAFAGRSATLADVGWDDEPEHSFFARMDGRVEMRSQARCDTQE